MRNILIFPLHRRGHGLGEGMAYKLRVAGRSETLDAPTRTGVHALASQGPL